MIDRGSLSCQISSVHSPFVYIFIMSISPNLLLAPTYKKMFLSSMQHWNEPTQIGKFFLIINC